MTDTIQPIQEQAAPTIQSAPSEPERFSEVKPDNIQALKYLGLTESLFDDSVMDKIESITGFLGTGDLQAVDIKLGNPHNLTKLDKIYSYVGLMKQSVALQAREALLREERAKYTK